MRRLHIHAGSLLSLGVWVSILGALAWLFGAHTSQAQSLPPLRPVLRDPFKYDLLPALQTDQPDLPQPEEKGGPPRLPLPKAMNLLERTPLEMDPVLQMGSPQASMPTPDFNFEGVSNIDGVLPPDTNGDVGPNHYVQWVNLSLAIWRLDRVNHTATRIFGPVPGNSLWNGFGGACETSNNGDPIVLYDHLADRWFISQFALPYFPSGPYYQCIAVSQSGDPSGAWYRYGFLFSNTKMNDYPKFGVWPDGYYMSVNQFTGGNTWGGAGVAVLERDKMLIGQPARMVYFDLEGVDERFGGMLPADLDGPPPPTGTPNYFVEVDDSTWIGPQDALRIWEFQVNWLNPNLSTFGISGSPNDTLPVANFNPISYRIPQPGTSIGLDNLGDRLMHRLQYRYFGGFQTLVTNHTVDANGRAGVRWYEVRDEGSGWMIKNQGTYVGSGSDMAHRWMGSAAMDGGGNLAIGYSLSSDSIYPSIAYAGRLATDPPNTLPQGEVMLKVGTGSQTHTAGRWGDYSMLTVDPTDNCTFWYTSEYLTTTSPASWQTRIGSFTFPSCLGGPKGSLQGTVTSGGSPVVNASVSADGYTTYTDANGFYRFEALPVGSYTMTVTAYGYSQAMASGVAVQFATTTTRNFSLAPLPIVNVSGKARDGFLQGWPLYARIDISAPGFTRRIFSNPVTGEYQVSLAQGVPHAFTISAVSPGYVPLNASVTPASGGTKRDFELGVDTSTCSAPGYVKSNPCNALNGGLVVGHVYDLNTGSALNDAQVARVDAPAEQVLTFATPEDPGQGDGLYILFSPSGDHDFVASKNAYGSTIQRINVQAYSVVSQDFALPAGHFTISPSSLTERLSAATSATRNLVLRNTGTFTATFSIAEASGAAAPLLPTGPFAHPTRHTSPKRLADLTAEAVYEYQPPQVGFLPGGQVLRSWASGLAHPWGIGYDTHTNSLWIGDVAVAGGDDRLHRFTPEGQPLGQGIDLSSVAAHFAADMTYNPFTRSFWQVMVSSGNCLVEVQPARLSLSGAEICPPFDQSQRGLAYNPVDGSYYSGSWTSGILYHFNPQGVVLDSINLNLNISGLAFNPATGHLFVLSNASVGYDVYVVDTGNAYAILGGFDIPGLEDFEQAGMSLDCNGHLWLVNQKSAMVYEVDSGEVGACAYADVPWLTVSPLSGALSPGASQTLQVTLEAGAAQAGQNQARLVISGDTPYGLLVIPVTLTTDYYMLYLPQISR